MRVITPDEFKKILPVVCDKETSQDPDGWKSENPLWGHCAVVALVAQDLFGGELLRGSLADAPLFAHLQSHYWNRLAIGDEDFTKAQFGENYPAGLRAELRDRSYVFSYAETARRYKLLLSRVAQAIRWLPSMEANLP